MTTAVATQRLKDVFGLDVDEARVIEALEALDTYTDFRYETLCGAHKINYDQYILLSVENTHPGNGAWQRYIDHLKSNYQTIVVQEVANKGLLQWFLRNGFERTKKHKCWVIWRKSKRRLL